jgi:hypothetical protein
MLFHLEFWTSTCRAPREQNPSLHPRRPRFDATRVILATAIRQADEIQDKADIVLLKPISINKLRELANRLK